MTELETLYAKLSASKGKPGLAARVAAIEAEIARLEGTA